MRSPNASRRNRGRSHNGRRNGSGINQVFDKNGAENKLKGNALQVHEKYHALARDAKSAGDSIKAENYLQHAEHFHRVHNSALNTHSENNNLKEKDDKQKNVILMNTDNSNDNKKKNEVRDLNKKVSVEKKLIKKNVKNNENTEMTD